MRPIKEIALNKLSVPPGTPVTEALSFMEEAGVAAVSVVENGEFFGITTRELAILADSEETVRDCVRGLALHLDSSMRTRDAAKAMVRAKADYAVVQDGTKFIGILTPLDLITDLGQSWDPLTGLSWSDRLREWGEAKLDSGQEITIVFFDLDNFGEYNKRFGHIVGDSVLKAVAQRILAESDPTREIVVRFGGDEFAVGTTRNQDEARVWAEKLAEQETRVAGVDEHVKFSAGIAGGKRAKAPSREHVTATLDNLINLASQNCTERKQDYLPTMAAITPLELGRVSVVDPLNRRVRVEIKQGDAWVAGESTYGIAIWNAVAQAAAHAVSQSKGTEPFTIDDTIFVASEAGHEVIVTGRTKSNQEFRATRALGTNIEESIVDAVLSADSSVRDM